MPKAIYVKACKTVVAGDDKFQSQIEGYLDTIVKTKLGSTLLAYFGTKAPSKVVEWPEEDVAVVILQFGLAKMERNAPICTKTCIDWKEQAAFRPKGMSDKDFVAALKIPLVRMPPEGWGSKDGMKIERGMLIGHDDFKAAPFEAGTHMDVVLFHELCHAYLIAAGISPKWDGHPFPANKPTLTCDSHVDVAVEEQVVCGLVYGRGLDCCENTYRAERKLPPRTSYKAVGIPVDAALGADFAKVWKEGEAALAEAAKVWGNKIAAVVQKNKFTKDVKAAFGDAKQATDLGLLEQPKLERKSSKLKFDDDSVEASGDVTASS